MPENQSSSIRPVTLTEHDWEEIYYALDTKFRAIHRGKYGDEDEPGDHRNWADHLERIMNAVGPDGTEAAARGVEPCYTTEPSSAESQGPRTIGTIQ